ncbi:lipoprotein-releasing ABC transporter permease subunit [Chitinibacteraceae bacterium HSL-7]
MLYELLIGLRYTRTKRRNGFISFISLISIAGIALGVAALIIVLSVMNGFQEEVRNRILGMSAHVQLVGNTGPLANWDELEGPARKTEGVIGAAPFVLGQGMFNAMGQVKGTLVRGVDPAREPQVSVVTQKLIGGQLDELRPGSFNIVLGWQMAAELGVTVGDKVTLITPQGQVTPAGLVPRFRQFTITGLFRADYYPYDAGLALINLEDAQKLFRMGDTVSGLRLALKDPMQARHVASQLSHLRGDVLASDWTQENPTYFRAVEIEKRMMFIILTLIVAVAAFNLVSTLVMVVTDKQADIAILRTLGSTPRSIMGIFVVQGTLSGVLGTIAGVAGGVLVATNLGTIVPFIEHIIGTQILSPDVYLITELPSRVEYSDVSSIAVISLILALTATLYPSWRASRVQPAEALRYE